MKHWLEKWSAGQPQPPPTCVDWTLQLSYIFVCEWIFYQLMMHAQNSSVECYRYTPPMHLSSPSCLLPLASFHLPQQPLGEGKNSSESKVSNYLLNGDIWFSCVHVLVLCSHTRFKKCHSPKHTLSQSHLWWLKWAYERCYYFICLLGIISTTKSVPAVSDLAHFLS